MDFESIVRTYLHELQDEYLKSKCGKQHTDELSFRPVLHKLFQEAAKLFSPDKKLSVVLEPKNQNGAGRPDWLIQDPNTFAVYGYVEAKGIDPVSFDVTPHEDQIKRYRELGHKLVITDGIEFLFCTPNKKQPDRVSVFNKKHIDSSRWDRLSINPKFEVIVQALFTQPTVRTYDEKTLVEQVAIRTRLLAEELNKFAARDIDEAINDDEKKAIALVNALRDAICCHSDSRLKTPDALSDFVAQVAMFTLLYAHRVSCNNNDVPKVKYGKIRKYISKLVNDGDKLKPFAELMKFISNHKESVFILEWVEDCIQFLSYVKMDKSANESPDYHKLFERFLAEYNAKMRFDFGAYYTPEPLAKYVVRVTSEIVKMVLSADIYAAHNTIIDPCCGTGSFLEEFMTNNPLGVDYKLCGFEILPAPYMLANYRMSIVERSMVGGPKKIKIVLANSLHNSVINGKANCDTIEGSELKVANVLSGKPLQLIIGNPPCSDTSRENQSEEYSEINKMMEDFRPPESERHGRQNTQKQIANPFMQFLRWSCHKILSCKTDAVIAFVVPSSFLEAESYRYARKYLAENFSSLWAVAVDADARTGMRSNSLFHTMQGRAVIIATRKYGVQNFAKKFHYADLSGLGYEEKVFALNESTKACIDRFAEYDIPVDTYSMVPAKAFNKTLYAKFWPISSEDGSKAIFKRHCSGVKLAPTALFTHVNSGALRRRSKDIADAGSVDAMPWFARQDKPPQLEKVEAFEKALKQEGDIAAITRLLKQQIRPYCLRPFLYSNVLLWEKVLNSYSRIGGGGTRLRPEIVESYKDRATFGFAMAHAPKDLNPSLTQFASFCWMLPDNDMCTRGNSHVYLNQFFNKKTKKIESNVDDELVTNIAAMLKCKSEDALKQIIFYVYAVLCSQVYLDEFEGALFTTNQSDKRARIPFVADKKIFVKIAELGCELANLEKPDYVAPNVLKIDVNGIVSKLPSDFHLNSGASKFDEEDETLVLSDGTKQLRIPCPLEIQRLNISGYDVFKSSWLKFYSYGFTHMSFGQDDLKLLLNLINTLSLRQKIIGDVDLLLEVVFADDNLIDFCD